LAALITCVGTLASLLLLWGTVKVLTLLVKAIKQSRSGWALEEDEDGERTEGPWAREPKSWNKWWKAKLSKWKNPNQQTDEQEPLLGEPI
jgi:hypothetical protein